VIGFGMCHMRRRIHACVTLLVIMMVFGMDVLEV
jgi:hypothetical protein